ncbi:hypothetical protein ACJRO7_020462 [Eucalyptus globulus]|uniref:CHCH domain-containing protein n=1 Tax=Eucalyptus globulus TaxID=34317 RepID=A0ABD3KI84_EUCGL
MSKLGDCDQYLQKKGVFPLDRMHECDQEKKDYLNCLKSSSHQSENRRFSKKYLECRMANLMARQDMSELGFGKEPKTKAPGANEAKRTTFFNCR